MSKTFGILLMSGNHTHQESYAAAFAADKRCRLIAVTDEPTVDKRRRTLNERLAKTHGIPYIADLAEALKRKDVDVVSVCAPPERRARIIIRCAQAGKHLYLDKSLCPALEEADAIVAAVERAKVKSYMFSFVSQPWARQAKELLEKKRIGELVAIHADTLFAKGRTGSARLGARRKEEFPPRRHQLVEAKREMDNTGVYPLTLIRWLTGRRFQTIYAITGNNFFAEHQKHNVEDFGLIAATLEGGLVATVSSGRYGWMTHPGFGQNRLVLVGTEETVIVDAHRPRVEVYTDETPWSPPSVHPEDPMAFWNTTQEEVHTRPKRTWLPLHPPANDSSYFIDQLVAGRDSELPAAEAAITTEALVAAYKSAATGEVVRLPLPRK